MSQKNEKIKIVVISGSMRPNSNTFKALSIVIDELNHQEKLEVAVIDPIEMKLHLPGIEGDSQAEQIQTMVSGATGVILSTPEYHGSYSSAIKLVIDNLGFPSVLAGKPVALLGVAAGQIGAIKALEHLRSVCSHVGSIVLPGPVSVANVMKVFDEKGSCLDEKIEEKIRGLAHTLLDYIAQNICPRKALEDIVRES